MELKLLCDCGTKFAFDVEPQDGKLPCQVFCPNCHKDSTELGNQLIQEKLSSPGSQLRLKSPAPKTEPEPARNSPAPEPAAVSSPSRMALDADRGPRPAPAKRSPVPYKTILSVLFVAFIGFTFVKKWYNRASTAIEILSSDEFEDSRTSESNFSFEDAVFLYVKHSNANDVGRVAGEYFNKAHRTRVSITNVVEDLDEAFGINDWYIFPAHNGYVPMYSGLGTTRQVYSGLAQHLASTYNSIVMIYRDVDFTGEFHFVVMEGEAKRLEAEMKLVGENLLDAVEQVTFTGEEWAKNHGYVEDSREDEFFEKFHWGHAEAISKNLGLKLWDQGEVDHPTILFLNVP